MRQRDLAACYEAVFHLPRRWDDRVAAIEKAIALRESIAKRFPATALYRRELATSHRALGSSIVAGSGLPIEPHITRALELGEQLCKENPDDPDLRNELGVHASRICARAHERRRICGSRAVFQASLGHS